MFVSYKYSLASIFTIGGCSGSAGSVGGAHLAPPVDPNSVESSTLASKSLFVAYDTPGEDGSGASTDTLVPGSTTTLRTFTPYTWYLTSVGETVAFKGFLFRLEDADTFGTAVDAAAASALSVDPIFGAESQVSQICTAIGVGGVTHTSNVEKTVAVAIVEAVEPGTYELQVTAVFDNGVDDVTGTWVSEWAFDNYTLVFEDVVEVDPTPPPTSATDGIGVGDTNNETAATTAPDATDAPTVTAANETSTTTTNETSTVITAPPFPVPCDICSPGSTMLTPGAEIIGTGITCGELQVLIDTQTFQYCPLLEELNEVINVAAWCGCEGALVPAQCRICQDNFIDSATEIADPFGPEGSNNTISCGDIAITYLYVVSSSICQEGIDTAGQLCCTDNESTSAPTAGPNVTTTATAATTTYEPTTSPPAVAPSDQPPAYTFSPTVTASPLPAPTADSPTDALGSSSSSAGSNVRKAAALDPVFIATIVGGSIAAAAVLW